MTYLDQARAGDWMPGHDLECIARFALERAIAEIERLAKERRYACTHGLALFYENDRYRHKDARGGYWGSCDAQPEQRRIAELKKELEALKPTKA
jgi:hypothetical protein